MQKRILDQPPHLVQVLNVRVKGTPICLGRNDRLHPPTGRLPENGIGIICFVRQKRLGLEAFR